VHDRPRHLPTLASLAALLAVALCGACVFNSRGAACESDEDCFQNETCINRRCYLEVAPGADAVGSALKPGQIAFNFQHLQGGPGEVQEAERLFEVLICGDDPGTADPKTCNDPGRCVHGVGFQVGLRAGNKVIARPAWTDVCGTLSTTGADDALVSKAGGIGISLQTTEPFNGVANRRASVFLIGQGTILCPPITNPTAGAPTLVDGVGLANECYYGLFAAPTTPRVSAGFFAPPTLAAGKACLNVPFASVFAFDDAACDVLSSETQCAGSPGGFGIRKEPTGAYVCTDVNPGSTLSWRLGPAQGLK